MTFYRSDPGNEAVPVDQQDAACRQFVNRVVEGFTVAAPVVNLAPLAGREQRLLLGVTAPGVLLAPAVENVLRR